MKRYSVQSVSTYRYSSPAAKSNHLVRLIPRAGNGQTIESARILVKPGPSTRERHNDFFGNGVDRFAVKDPHDEISFTMQATVAVERPTLLLAPDVSWQEAAEQALHSRRLDASGPSHFVRQTDHTLADEAITQFAGRFFTPGARLDPCIDAMCRAIQDEFRYDAAITTVETTAMAAFAKGAGVCQDFAHMMLAACRSHGVPAHYVSGYLRTDPPPGQPRLAGADAMHAWVSVWMGEASGWVDFDPTNGCRVGEDHITVAAGRDYLDVLPVSGEVIGGGDQSHTVSVDVVARD